MNTPLNRRSFLRQSALAGAGFLVARVSFAGSRTLSPNEKLNIGIIGVAHQGNYDLSNVATENIVALCDVDDSYLAAAAKRFSGAKTYNDFRRLLDQKDIDAVVIATPDHTHAVATVAALRSGRHVYCEKPLTRTISECRVVMDTARKTKRVTQIGTQIHAGGNYRRVVELVQSGAIGAVDRVHVWVDATYGGRERPKDTPVVPSQLHYDLWLGPVSSRPYSPEYLPGSWRNWWAFGGGALADFGCHYMDLPHWALSLRSPLSAQVLDGPPVHPESVPPWMIVRYEYPKREAQPPVTLTWYHGGRQPPPDILSPDLAGKWRSGVLFMGTKGNLLADYGRHLLLPEKDFAGFVAPAHSIPDSIGHHAEWVLACKTSGSTTCNFEYSGALTEAVLLGNVAYRTGKKIEWDSKNFRANGCPEANSSIRHQYRSGWKI
ncbi:MAG TPA: Gfo/Idh/MocA family oxidoreductase [Verrucomicrobiae bacterium]